MPPLSSSSKINNTYVGPCAPYEGSRGIGPVPRYIQSSEHVMDRPATSARNLLLTLAHAYATIVKAGITPARSLSLTRCPHVTSGCGGNRLGCFTFVFHRYLVVHARPKRLKDTLAGQAGEKLALFVC